MDQIISFFRGLDLSSPLGLLVAGGCIILGITAVKGLAKIALLSLAVFFFLMYVSGNIL